VLKNRLLLRTFGPKKQGVVGVWNTFHNKIPEGKIPFGRQHMGRGIILKGF
jgi:hypothetical protein